NIFLNNVLKLIPQYLFLGVPTETVTTCEGNHVHRLSCDIGVISVETALYGRADSVTCSEGQPSYKTSTTDCSLTDTLALLKRRCDGKRLCELSPNGFGASDPCRGTYKYLQTKYNCFPASQSYLNTSTGCEGLKIHHCFQLLILFLLDEGLVINVYSADYGRHDQTTCSYQRSPSKIRNTDCAHPTSHVSESCTGKNSCIVKASNSVFGDPCAGTYKYLECGYSGS
uniref:SUEL-type lectin domain-containing protein n=1 Tax=Dicentrarchus labrax TaxID=13489 RepID=A0A8C4IFR1_DICLA